MLNNIPTRAFHVMAKPTGSECNLNCSYCFYLEKQALYPQQQMMSDETLENYVRSYIACSHLQDEVAFTWQGGEPTLMGLDFYRKAVEFQQRYGAGRKITNSFQTNGLLITDKWCEFFVKHDFLIGLSLDGPEEIHNRLRVTRSGNPTHHRVMQALRRLQQHGVRYNILACVNRYNVRHPELVYDFLRDAGVNYIQFLPVVERQTDATSARQGLSLHGPGGTDNALTPWSVPAEDYGRFLLSVFKRWFKRDVGTVFVMNIEWAFANFMNIPGAVCHHQPTCGRSVICEHNGDIYACDHYVYPHYLLGNIAEKTFAEMVDSDAQKKFGTDKLRQLPQQCRRCEVLKACWGGCPKHRFLLTKEKEPGLNYLCPGFRLFFSYLPPYFRAMAEIIASGRPASDIMKAELIHIRK